MKFAYAWGHIVTALDNGDIGLNAKVVCKVTDANDALMTTLIEQANMLHESLSVFEPMGKFAHLEPKE